MKFKRIFCIALAAIMMIGTFSALSSMAFATQEKAADNNNGNDIVNKYVQDGLVSLYSGKSNTENGYDANSDKWYDLVGDNDLPITKDEKNYFTEDGFRVEGNSTVQYFPKAIVDLVNANEFTVEILLGTFTPVGASYGTFLNSTNDNFALFRMNSNNTLVLKNNKNARPSVDEALENLSNGLVTITYKVGGKSTIYCNGVMAAESDCATAIGADDLFIGQKHNAKTFDSTYKCIRFYNRELTKEEVYENAVADGKVTAEQEVLQHPGYVSVAQPKTKIVGDVAMVRRIDSKDELTAMMAGKSLPATAIYTINSKLEVVNGAGEAFSTVADVLKATEFKVLTCFEVLDMETADAISTYLKLIKFYDVQFMSSNKDVLKYVRSKVGASFGMLDLRNDYADKKELTKEDLLNIRRAVKTYNAYVAILPVELCTNENVQYLYDRQVNVWAYGSDTPTTVEQYFALLSGAVGIVSDVTESYLDIACNKLQDTTMTRLPINIGHRGIPSKSPENCIEGAQYAYELGAEVIEIDVYLTKDNQAVLMHDPTTGRTCNKDLTVANATLAELTALYCNKGYENVERFKDAKVPSLDDFLAAFVGTDVRFYIEVKTGGATLANIVKDLVEKNNMYGQVSVISFNGDILKDFREVYPEMSVGGLCMQYMQGDDPEADLRSAMSFVGGINATLNPRYTADGSTSHYDYAEDDLRAAMIRGLQMHPWTFQGTDKAYANHFLWGYAGLTGDNADSLAKITRKIAINSELTFTENAATKITHKATTYVRNEADVAFAYAEIIDGQGTVDGANITPTAEGELTFISYSQHRINKRNIFVMYTQPITVNVAADPTKPETPDVPSTPAGEDTSDTAATTTVETETNTEEATTAAEKSGCGSYVGSAVFAIVSVGAAYVVSRKKKED